MSRPLTDFMATLHKNGVEEKKLSKYVQQTIVDDMITFNIRYVHRHAISMSIINGTSWCYLSDFPASQRKDSMAWIFIQGKLDRCHTTIIPRTRNIYSRIAASTLLTLPKEIDTAIRRPTNTQHLLQKRVHLCMPTML